MENRQDRYARQQQFSPIGRDGQTAIEQSSVAVIGCGALGSVAAEILARAGVGRLRLIDRDIVQWSNLQRQSLYTESDAQRGVVKSAAAAEQLSQINSDITIEPVVVDLTPSNFASAVGNVDLLIDAVDNFPLRFLINDWSLKTSTPWVHGGCVGATGQVRLFDGSGSPCFRCLVPQPPPASAVQTCDTAGVVGAATHAIASLQCIEALKWLSGNRDRMLPTVQSFDFWSGRHRQIELPPSLSGGCTACDHRRYEFLDGDAGASMESAVVLCGRDSVQIAGRDSVELAMMADRWSSLGEVVQSRFFVRLSIDEKVVTLFRDGRLLVDGTDDIVAAKSLVGRLIG